MQKILSIVGTTATGKTDLALYIARELISKKKYDHIDIISVDSRQIFQGLEITTGADIPKEFTKKNNLKLYIYPYWQNPQNNISLHGISIILPNQQWSISHFKEMANNIILQKDNSKKFTIIVGGTGLYHNHLTNSDTHLTIKPNTQIRKKAEKMTVTQLQNWLKELSPQRLTNMNNSDKNNPRRLIRAIEINLEKPSKEPNSHTPIIQKYIGLFNDLESITDSIKKRVEKRFENGSIEEVTNLIKNYPNITQAHSSMGVKEITDYLNGSTDIKTTQRLWATHELQYAKRQITWWKKQPNLITFEAKSLDKKLVMKTIL